MKVKHFILSLVAVAFLSSGIGTDRTLSVGSSAPKIETIQGINVEFDANSEPKKKVVSFWNPKKPASRIANRELYKSYGSQSSEYQFISICTDEDETLMRQVMKKDGLADLPVISSNNLSPRVIKDYNADEALQAFIIDEKGKILQIL